MRQAVSRSELLGWPSIMGSTVLQPAGRRSGETVRGIRAAVPVVVGYVPIGFAYGVLGKTAGVPMWLIVGMSLLVYAGSAQFLAVSLLDHGATAVTILTTVVLVNLRHVLYSFALSSRLEPMTRPRLAWVAAELTDESFVMETMAARNRRRSLSFPFVAGLQGTSHLSWLAGSVAGALFASFMADPARYGLDFALVAMFLGLLALQLRERREVVVAVTAAAISLPLALAGVGTIGVIVATLGASAVGLLVGRPLPESSEPTAAEAALEEEA